MLPLAWEDTVPKWAPGQRESRGPGFKSQQPDNVRLTPSGCPRSRECALYASEDARPSTADLRRFEIELGRATTAPRAAATLLTCGAVLSRSPHTPRPDRSLVHRAAIVVVGTITRSGESSAVCSSSPPQMPRCTKRPRPACDGPGSFRHTMRRVEWRDNPPRDRTRALCTGNSLAATGRPRKSLNRVFSDHRGSVSPMARRDHRVEKVVNSAPGSGGRFRPPDAELGSLPPEPLTHTPTRD